MNFLELCQAVARESGTVGNLGEPSSVESQTGRLARIVHWTRDAYSRIQLESADWRWMRATLSGGEVITGARTVSAGALGLTRFRRWVYRSNRAPSGITLYDNDIGRSDEGHLLFEPWESFYDTYMVGGQAETTGKPVVGSVSPARELAFYPLPDKAYRVSCQYQKSAQSLAANTETPEMPEDYHMAIVYRALTLMLEYDEAFAQIAYFGNEYSSIMDKLREEQLPRVTLAGPLA